jgi:hypothetical protein
MLQFLKEYDYSPGRDLREVAGELYDDLPVFLGREHEAEIPMFAECHHDATATAEGHLHQLSLHGPGLARAAGRGTGTIPREEHSACRRDGWGVLVPHAGRARNPDRLPRRDIGEEHVLPSRKYPAPDGPVAVVGE